MNVIWLLKYSSEFGQFMSLSDSNCDSEGHIFVSGNGASWHHVWVTSLRDADCALLLHLSVLSLSSFLLSGCAALLGCEESAAGSRAGGLSATLLGGTHRATATLALHRNDLAFALHRGDLTLRQGGSSVIGIWSLSLLFSRFGGNFPNHLTPNELVSN